MKIASNFTGFPTFRRLNILERMCKLLYYKIRPIFVFDGPGVPHFKKRVQVDF